MKQIRSLITSGLIDRTVIDKLIRYEKVKYTVEDIVFFAKSRVISRENPEGIAVDSPAFLQRRLNKSTLTIRIQYSRRTG